MLSRSEIGFGPLAEGEGEVAGLLDRPFAGGVGGDAAQMHPAGFMLDEHQDVQSFQQHGVQWKKSTARLHGPAGKPCPARPWFCLLCPLAVFAPRHAPNLLRLKAFFSRQWRQMPAAQFMAVFGPYSQRVAEVLDRLGMTVVARAADAIGDRDNEIPLRPEECTR